MSKAYLNALYEEGSRQDIFNWLCRLDAENDELRKQLRDKTDLQNEHGKRVEERQRVNG